MTIYIAGKITGDPYYKQKFNTVSALLRGDGHKVINPADLPSGMSNADCMRICFAMMDTADVVAFLPDYTESRGAMLEHAWCHYVGKPVAYVDAIQFAFARGKEAQH